VRPWARSGRPDLDYLLLRWDRLGLVNLAVLGGRLDQAGLDHLGDQLGLWNLGSPWHQ